MKYVATLAAVVVLVAVACVPAAPPDGEPDLCQPGSFSTTGEEPCDPAPAGTFVDSEGATEATACAPGTYQDQEGQTSCDPAEPGSYVDVAGAETATLCPLGRYQPLAGQTSCLLAPIGTYVDTTGAITAINCPVGQTTASEGSTSSSDCYAPAATLAIAYSNLDLTPGYDDSGTDRLVSRLVDTNLDGVPSVGDTIEFGGFPLNFAGTLFGDFQTDSLSVTGVSGAQSNGIGVVAAGFSYTWSDGAFTPAVEAYYEGNSGEVALVDSAESTATDLLQVLGTPNPSPPSDPSTPIQAQQVNETDDDFLDVEIHTPANP